MMREFHNFKCLAVAAMYASWKITLSFHNILLGNSGFRANKDFWNHYPTEEISPELKAWR